MSAAQISVQNLSVVLGENRVLSDLSFDVEKGSLVGIIGPNGAGKSSLLKCVGGLNRKISGTVLIDGTPISSIGEKMIARRMAWVHQSGADLLPFTVKEFALMARYPWHSHFGGNSEGDLLAAESAMREAGVSALAERTMNSLSGGERQRALFASALAQDTDILLLDEPTSFLDYRHQVEMLELIERINRDYGKTVLLVTHDINAALHGADKIIALKNGRLAWSGTTELFLKNGLLPEIFEVEFEYFGRGEKDIPYAVPKRLT